jgi:hypothetical protein
MLLLNLPLDSLFSTHPGNDFDTRNTPFCNILRSNPSLAIFYADFFGRRAANSSLVKDLEIQSGCFFDPD